MTCEQVRGSAAGLASLADDDQERQDAYRHAQGCRDCARALAEGERLLALIDELPAPPAPSAELLARVAAEIHAEMDDAAVGAAAQTAEVARPRHGARRLWPARPIAAAAATLVFAAFAALVVRFYHRPIEATIWVQALIVVALAAAGAALATMWRSPWIPAGLLGVSIAFALLRGRGDGIGAHDCTVLELVASAMALVPAGIVVAMGRARGGVVTLAGLSAAGALSGQAALDVLCIGRGWLPHLLVFHTGGVLVAMLVGAAAGALPPLRATARSR